MKAFFRVFALVMLAALLLVGCSSPPSSLSNSTPSAVTMPSAPPDGAQIALIALEAQVETPMVKTVWNTISLFSGEEGVSNGLYKASEEELLPTLDLAVKGGAQVVVLVGEEMQELLRQAQTSHPAVKFILVGANDNASLLANGAGIRFSAEQAGWLAGYAAVADGMKKIAFMESEALTDQRYALGFLLGADAAAEKNSDGSKKISAYAVNVLQNEYNVSWQQYLARLFQEGTQVVFANAEGTQSEVLALAREGNAQIIATSTDDSTGSSILAALQYNPHNALLQLLASWKDSKFPGGQMQVAGVANEGVSLDMENAGFENFTATQYKNVMKLFTSGALAQQIDEVVQLQENGKFPLPTTLALEHVWVAIPASPEPASASAPSGSSSSSGATQESTPPASEEAPSSLPAASA